jgi:hypothetical protein
VVFTEAHCETRVLLDMNSQRVMRVKNRADVVDRTSWILRTLWLPSRRQPDFIDAVLHKIKFAGKQLKDKWVKQCHYTRKKWTEGYGDPKQGVRTTTVRRKCGFLSVPMKFHQFHSQLDRKRSQQHRCKRVRGQKVGRESDIPFLFSLQWFISVTPQRTAEMTYVLFPTDLSLELR